MYVLLLQRTLIKLAYGCCTKPMMPIFVRLYGRLKCYARLKIGGCFFGLISHTNVVQVCWFVNHDTYILHTDIFIDIHV